MNCQDYIFQLTSGQLEQAGWFKRKQCAVHHFVCRACRNFTHNDQQLLGAVHARQQLLNELPLPRSEPED